MDVPEALMAYNVSPPAEVHERISKLLAARKRAYTEAMKLTAEESAQATELLRTEGLRSANDFIEKLNNAKKMHRPTFNSLVLELLITGLSAAETV